MEWSWGKAGRGSSLGQGRHGGFYCGKTGIEEQKRHGGSVCGKEGIINWSVTKQARWSGLGVKQAWGSSLGQGRHVGIYGGKAGIEDWSVSKKAGWSGLRPNRLYGTVCGKEGLVDWALTKRARWQGDGANKTIRSGWRQIRHGGVVWGKFVQVRSTGGGPVRAFGGLKQSFENKTIL